MEILFLLLCLTSGHPSPTSGAEPPTAEVGVLPGHWALDAQGFRSEFLPDSGFGHGVYAVPLAADTLVAFDLGSPATTRCWRIDPSPFTFSYDSRRHYRFRREDHWDSRDVLFVRDRRLRPTRCERLEWQPWPGDSDEPAIPPARR